MRYRKRNLQAHVLGEKTGFWGQEQSPNAYTLNKSIDFFSKVKRSKFCDFKGDYTQLDSQSNFEKKNIVKVKFKNFGFSHFSALRNNRKS